MPAMCAASVSNEFVGTSTVALLCSPEKMTLCCIAMATAVGQKSLDA
jgi:hypothetical protein